MYIKRFLKKIMSIIVVCMVIGGYTITTFAENIVWENNKITVFTVDYDEIMEIINTPSMEVLEKVHGDYIEYLSITDNNMTPIKCESSYNGEKHVSRIEDGWGWIGNERLYTSFIDFASNKDNLMSNFLAENGVVGEVEKAVVLDIVRSHLAIWVKVNQEDYFITVNQFIEDLWQTDEEEYTYRLYSYLEYCTKYGINDARLIVNGTDLTAGNYIKVYGGDAFIPLRVVMENLGVAVDWNPEDETVTLYNNDITYVFDPETCDLLVNGIKAEYMIAPGDREPLYANIIDGRTIVNDGVMNYLFRYIHAKLNVDYDNLTIEISEIQ